MANIAKVRDEADIVKACLNEEFKAKINTLTTCEINEVVSILERTGINKDEVIALKAEIIRATNKNQVITRVLETPGALCEQMKDVVSKIKR